LTEESSVKHGELTGQIITGIINVYKALGPGFDVSVYRNALMIELRNEELPAEAEEEIVVEYEGEEVGTYSLDILVEETVVLVLKTVPRLGKVDYAETRACLRAAGLEVGLLVSFAGETADFRRVEL
jgi:GxxExxY protein